MEDYFILMEYFGWDFPTIYEHTPRKVIDWILLMLVRKGKDEDNKGNLKFRGIREHELYRSLIRTRGLG